MNIKLSTIEKKTTKWKITLIITGALLGGFFSGAVWERKTSSTLLPVITPLTVETAKGFLGGRDDILNGRDFKEGFYRPPKHSRNFWKGYREGYQND